MLDALKGAVVVVTVSLPMVILSAFVYRFPIPMGSYIGFFSRGHSSPGVIETIKMASFAWLFYGILGGFIVLALGGALAGGIIRDKISPNDKRRKNKLILLWGIAVAFIGVGILANLDFIIGPW